MAPISLVDLVASLPSEVSENPFGWGPPPQTEKTLDGVPYAPYSKGDKLGRMADWNSDGKDGGQRGRGQYNRNYRDQQVYGAGAGSIFAIPVAEDESSFSVVDNTRTTGKRTFGRGGGTVFRGRGQRGGSQRGGSQRGGRGGFQRAGGRQGGAYDNRGGRGGRGRRCGWRDWDKPQRNRDASVTVRPEWVVKEEVDFMRLNKLNLDMPQGEDLADYGFLHYYDRSFDKLQLRAPERKLQALERISYNVTTTADPVLAELADKNEATVFATSDILSVLMCAPRSVYSWDIVIIQQGDKIFLDKRPKASIDLVTVNENAADAPLETSESGAKTETINSPAALAMEATIINHTFAFQTVKEDTQMKVDLANPNPFHNPQEESDPLASKGYKYRRFDLSTEAEEEPLKLIVRTEVDAIAQNPSTGAEQQVLLRALNEFDNKAQGAGGALDWRTKLVSQRGAVVATEMKNNSCKLARWTTQAILAKADQIKLGFVSRANPRSNTAHSILGVISYKPREFATQMNLNIGNGWAIVRTIVDLVRGASKAADEEEGNTNPEKLRKYVLIKDPNRSMIRLYAVPPETFEEDDDAAMPEQEVIEEEE